MKIIKKKKTRLSKTKGLSLMEVMIAIFIITVGLVGSLTLISFSISSASLGKSKIIAANLVQEGMEIVRNVRDSNWLSGENWRTGLNDGDWLVQYNSSNLVAFSDNPLKIDSDGFYGYGTGTATKFSRKITISTLGDNEIKVVCQVYWKERGRSQNITAENHFLNWK